MNELSQRILTALVLVLAVWAWYFHLHSPWFEAVLALLGFATTCELVLLMKLKARMLYILGGLIFWLAVYLNMQAVWLPLLLFLWFLLFVLSSRNKAQSFANFAGAIWMMGWLVLFVFVIGETHASRTGQGLVIGICLAVWASDIAAYFVGRQWGKRKLCPAISPGKSVEGLLGGLFFGVPVAVSCWLYWGVMEMIPAMILALIAVIAGVLGDLSESSLKRMVGAKDSGCILPGHGGLLDRLDAIIMAVPVSWAIWSLL